MARLPAFELSQRPDEAELVGLRLVRTIPLRVLPIIAGGAVAFSTERAEDPDTTNTTAYAIGASFTPAADSLLILGFGGTDTAATFAPTISESGMDLSWTQIHRGQFDNGTVFADVSAHWAAVGGSPSATTVTVTWDEALTGTVGWIGEFAGHNATTPIKAGQITGGALASGVETSSLPSAPDSDSLVVYLNWIFRNPPAWDASGDSWTEEMDNGYATPAMGQFVAHKANDQSISYTGTNGASYGIMFEIDASAGDTLDAALVDVTPDVLAAKLSVSLSAALVDTTPDVLTAALEVDLAAQLVDVSFLHFTAALEVDLFAALVDTAPDVLLAAVVEVEADFLDAQLVDVTPDVLAAAISVSLIAQLVDVTFLHFTASLRADLAASLVDTAPDVLTARLTAALNAALVDTTPDVLTAKISAALGAQLVDVTPDVLLATLQTNVPEPVVFVRQGIVVDHERRGFVISPRRQGVVVSYRRIGQQVTHRRTGIDSED